MVIIIDSKSEFEDFLEKCRDFESLIIVPLYCDESKHPNETSLSLLVVSFSEDENYILCFNHHEAVFEINSLTFLESFEEVYVFNKKKFLQCFGGSVDLIDIELLKWFKTTQKLNFKKVPKYFHLFPRSGKNISAYNLPICKISDHYGAEIEDLHEIVSCFRDLCCDRSFLKYNNRVIEVFSEIESNGMAIDSNKFHDIFSEKITRQFGNIVYTNYNIYTSTGRPSNANNNINFGALDPEENQKGPFISRFSDGVLLNFDYDAFHLRLIGKLIGYDIPRESFHTYLGKKYYNEDSLSEEQYEESKKISFQLLYGDDIDEARNIDFFDLTYDLRDELWDLYKEYKVIQTPKFKRKIDGEYLTEMNPGKVFSYIIQAYETEYNVSVLEDILSVLEDYKSEVILYTYDSFLFDYSLSDGKELVKEIKSIMEGESMLVKGYIGKKFDEMKKISV